MGHSRQERGLDLGGIVHTGGNAVGEQFHEEGFLAGRGVLDQFDQCGHLFGIQGQGRNAEGGTFGNMGSIGLQHGGTAPLGFTLLFYVLYKTSSSP